MSAVETIIAGLEAASANIAAIYEEAGKQIKPLLQNFLKEHPEIVRVQWHQYTPYFNDGEECVFGTGELYGFVAGGEDFDNERYPEESDFAFDAYTKNPKLVSAESVQALNNLSKAFNNDTTQQLLKEVFGDHVTVIVTKDGVATEEYEHD